MDVNLYTHHFILTEGSDKIQVMFPLIVDVTAVVLHLLYNFTRFCHMVDLICLTFNPNIMASRGNIVTWEMAQITTGRFYDQSSRDLKRHLVQT